MILSLATPWRPSAAAAQEPPSPAGPAPSADELRAKIRATEAARDDLMRRVEAGNAKSRSSEAQRDAHLRRISGSICAGCGSRPGPEPKRRAAHAAPPASVDDIDPRDPSLAGGLE